MSPQTNPRIEYVIANLQSATRKKWQAIADESGVPEGTIRKIFYRETKNPTSNTIEALYSYFEKQEKKKRK